ncbi:hypothetical protein SGLAM104S_08568 [Streptomyces glaucescens]
MARTFSIEPWLRSPKKADFSTSLRSDSRNRLAR